MLYHRGGLWEGDAAVDREDLNELIFWGVVLFPLVYCPIALLFNALFGYEVLPLP